MLKYRLVMMMVALLSLTAAVADEPVSVFLTAGQSNTAGRCMNENLPDYIKALGDAIVGKNSFYVYRNVSSSDYFHGVTIQGDTEGRTASAINSISTVTVKGNGKIYNLAGQQVTASYKGIVIKNGKKMVQK